MQSIVIASKIEKIKDEYVQNFCNEEEINPIDITTIKQEKSASASSKTSKKVSIGIESIKIIYKSLYLTPIKSKVKAIVIKNAETLTIEAQNALLKILEEPPPTAIIILLTSNIDFLLPTVLSRCSIIELDTKQNEYSEKEFEENQKALESLISANIGEKLKLAQDISGKKEEALVWLEKMILTLRNLVIKDIFETRPQGSEAKNLDLLTSFQKTHIIVSTTNVSPRLALENLFLVSCGDPSTTLGTNAPGVGG